MYLKKQSFSGIFGQFRKSNCQKITKQKAKGQVFHEFVTVENAPFHTMYNM